MLNFRFAIPEAHLLTYIVRQCPWWRFWRRWEEEFPQNSRVNNLVCESRACAETKPLIRFG